MFRREIHLEDLKLLRNLIFNTPMLVFGRSFLIFSIMSISMYVTKQRVAFKRMTRQNPEHLHELSQYFRQFRMNMISSFIKCCCFLIAVNMHINYRPFAYENTFK